MIARLKWILALAFLSFSTTIIGAEDKAVSMTLTQNGKPNATIILAEEPTDAARWSAYELQFHIFKMTGAVLPIENDQKKVRGNTIIVGDSKLSRHYGYKDSDFKSQEYLIEVKSRVGARDLILIGKDWQGEQDDPHYEQYVAGFGKPIYRVPIDYAKCVGVDFVNEPAKINLIGLVDEKSTSYAAYDFLERYCGVRWLDPNPELGTHFPQTKTLTVKVKRVRRVPSMETRSISQASPNWGSQLGFGHMFVQGGLAGRNEKLYNRRIRMGGLPWYSIHAIGAWPGRFHPKYAKIERFKKIHEGVRPELFHRDKDGKALLTHPNLSSQAFVDQVAKDLRDHFNGGKIFGLRATGNVKTQPSYVCLSPDDCYANFFILADPTVEQKYKDMLLEGQKYNTDVPGAFGHGAMSNYVFTFINRVAKKIQDIPNARITVLAYEGYYAPPSFDLEPNVDIVLCIDSAYCFLSAVQNQNKLYYDEWIKRTKKVGNPIHMWHYYIANHERGSGQRYRTFPTLCPKIHTEYMKKNVQDGIQGVFMCGAPPALTLSLQHRIMFDKDLDVDELLDDHFKSFYGPAAKQVQALVAYLENRVSDERNYPVSDRTGATEITTARVQWDFLGTAEVMANLYKLVGRAEKVSGLNDLQRKRIRRWRKLVDYMALGKKAYHEGVKITYGAGKKFWDADMEEIKFKK